MVYELSSMDYRLSPLKLNRILKPSLRQNEMAEGIAGGTLNYILIQKR